MNRHVPLSRRRFVVTSSLALATLALRPASSAPMGGSPAPRVVFDPNVDAAVRFASVARQHGSDCHPMTGDRYRFARGLLAMADRRDMIAGLCTYADFLVLTGTIQELHYRLVGHGTHGVQHHCHGELTGCEGDLARQPASWPEVLATYIATGSASRGAGSGWTRIGQTNDVTAVTWLMKPRSAVQ
jgi:hypothetical protein